jgi:hypothetical protein
MNTREKKEGFPEKAQANDQLGFLIVKNPLFGYRLVSPEELEFACCQARKSLERVSCLLLHITTGTAVEDGGEGVGDIC